MLLTSKVNGGEPDLQIYQLGGVSQALCAFSIFGDFLEEESWTARGVCVFKGTVARDLLASVFFMDLLYIGPRF